MPENVPIAYAQANQERHLQELFDLLRIPSVSAQPKHAKDMERAAHYVADAMRQAGLENIELVDTGGFPLVYADWLHAEDAPTVLVYGHYDVQPAEPIEKWDSAPFEPTIRDGKIFARGATDDKGQMFAHIKGVEAHLKGVGKLPVNVKFVIEGEEEVGSENLDATIKRLRQRLACDVVLVSDTAMKSEKEPAITYSLRGLVYFQVDVEGPDSDLHSGTWGGSLANPAEALVQALAAMKDAKTGKVKIPGFYDGVRVAKAEREAIAKSGFTDTQYKRQMGVKALWGEKNYTAAERTSVRPTFEINGVYGGYQGDGAKTVIPRAAGAKVSMRLVEGQDPKKIAKNFQKALKDAMLPGVKVTLTQLSAGMGAKVPLDHWAMEAASRAIKDTFGKKPLFLAEGGSIPVVATFKDILGVDTILMGFGLHDENLHAPNEHFRVNNYYRGIEASARFFDEIAKVQL